MKHDDLLKAIDELPEFAELFAYTHDGDELDIPVDASYYKQLAADYRRAIEAATHLANALNGWVGWYAGPYTEGVGYIEPPMRRTQQALEAAEFLKSIGRGGTAAMNSDKLDAAREAAEGDDIATRAAFETDVRRHTRCFLCGDLECPHPLHERFSWQELDRMFEVWKAGYAAAQNTWHDIEKDGLPKKEGWYWWTRLDGKVVKIMYYYDGPEDDEDNRNVFGHMLAWRPIDEPQPYRKEDE